MPPAMRRKVHTRTPVADDLELHTSTIRSAGQTFFEVRQYVPSLKQYGRGVTVPDTASDAGLRAITEGVSKHFKEINR